MGPTPIGYGSVAEAGRIVTPLPRSDLGGYVSVVTRSGTHVLHGTVYDYIRDDTFNEKNALLGAVAITSAGYSGAVASPVCSKQSTPAMSPRRISSGRCECAITGLP